MYLKSITKAIIFSLVLCLGLSWAQNTITQVNYRNADNSITGDFRQQADGSWVETNYSGQYFFEETGRDQNSVYLRDTRGRDISIKLDTQRNVVVLNGQDYYTIIPDLIALTPFIPTLPLTPLLTPQRGYTAADFVGEWINEDPNTRGTTRLVISLSGNTLTVQGYGSCSPTDCVWDPFTAAASEANDGEFSTRWTLSWAIKDFNYKLLSDSRLQAYTFTDFIDDSGRSDSTSEEYFTKQTLVFPMPLPIPVPLPMPLPTPIPPSSGPYGERVRVTVDRINVEDDCDGVTRGDGDIYGTVSINGYPVLDIYIENQVDVATGNNVPLPANTSQQFDYYYDENGYVTIAGKLADDDDIFDELIGDWNIAVPFSASMYGTRSVRSAPDCASVLTYTIERVGMIDSPKVAQANDATFNVLAYNVFMKPGLFGTANEERAALIPRQVLGFDAIVFSEIFDNASRNELLGGLRGEYPYRTEIVSSDLDVDKQDGGVIILSKWPIERQAELRYGVCDNTDCLSDKGAVYARIKKGSRYYNLFGTHTQAWHDGASTRAEQFRRLKSFIDAQGLPTSEALLIGGDLNVDLYNNSEYARMLQLLNASHPTQTGNFSYDSLNNGLADDGSREYLDYVLYSNAHLRPNSSGNVVIMPRSNQYENLDLSDHFGVAGGFVFP